MLHPIQDLLHPSVIASVQELQGLDEYHLIALQLCLETQSTPVNLSLAFSP